MIKPSLSWLSVVLVIINACQYGRENKRGEKQRQACTDSRVVFVVASYYQSLQIIILLLQACLLEIYLFCKI